MEGGDGVIEIGYVDEKEPAELFGGFGKWPHCHQRRAVADADAGGGRDRVQRRGGDEEQRRTGQASSFLCTWTPNERFWKVVGKNAAVARPGRVERRLDVSFAWSSKRSTLPALARTGSGRSGIHGHPITSWAIASCQSVCAPGLGACQPCGYLFSPHPEKLWVTGGSGSAPSW